MKLKLLRAFFITACLLLVMEGLNAQYGRGRGRSYSYRHYNNYNRYYGGGSRLYLGFSSPGFYYNYSPYYRSYGGYYGGFSRPRIGIHVNILPRGYSRFYLGRVPYYYYGGSYYRPGPRPDDYEVIDAPLGASVPELPESAKVVVINDQKFYETEGTYYKEDIRDNGEIWYTVVGKNGKVDTDNLPQAYDEPQEGDVIDKLPPDCRKVTLKGNTYWVSPDDVYYEETIEHNTVKYRVAGK